MLASARFAIRRRFFSTLPASGSSSGGNHGNDLPLCAVTQQQKDRLLKQAPNRSTVWSVSQEERAKAMSGPRFEQMDIERQPAPLAAIDLIRQQPVIKVDKRVASCDGGGGPLGHPKVYINLDPGRPEACGYCGLQFQFDHHH